MWKPGRVHIGSRKGGGQQPEVPELTMPPGSNSFELMDDGLAGWMSAVPSADEVDEVRPPSQKPNRQWWPPQWWLRWSQARQAKAEAKANAKVDAAQPDKSTPEGRERFWQGKLAKKAVAPQELPQLPREEPEEAGPKVPNWWQRLRVWWEIKKTVLFSVSRPSFKVVKQEKAPKPPMTPRARMLVFGPPLLFAAFCVVFFVGKVVLNSKMKPVEWSQDEQPIREAVATPRHQMPTTPVATPALPHPTNNSDDEIRQILIATGSRASVEEFKEADLKRKAWQNNAVASSGSSSPWTNFHAVAAPAAPPPSK